MTNVIINNIPSAQRKEYGYKSLNKSHDHNVNQDTIMNDILDLFNKANSIERTISRNENYIKAENTMLLSINKKIQNKFEDLYQKYEELKNDATERRMYIYPDDCYINDKTHGAVIEDKTDTITKRYISKISKFAVFDDVTNDMFLPDTLSVAITNDTVNGIITSNDNDIYAPFYKNNNLYWTRRIVTDNTVEKVRVNYIITLPDEIMTTALMNELYINPLMCKVVQIYYRYGDSSLWESLQGQTYHPAIQYAQEDSIESDVNSIRPIKLNFEPVKINQIKIVVESNMYVEGETNLRNFYFGIKEIAGYINYYSDYQGSSFTFETALPDDNKYEITGIQAHYNNGSNYGVYSEDFAYDFYYKDSNEEYHKITDTFPFIPQTNELKVKCTFGERYDEISIKKIELLYKKIN